MKCKLYFFALFLIFLSSSSFAEHTRVTNPNAFGVELFGRGILYGLSFDRVVNDDLAAGVGFGSVGTKDSAGNDTGQTATIIPVYVNLYLARDQGSLYLTAGADLITNGSALNGFTSSLGNVGFTSAPVLATFGLGYESRSDSGFLFRLSGYGIVARKVAPWFGFTFGYAF